MKEDQTVTLPCGLKLTGDPKKIVSSASALGYSLKDIIDEKTTYYSESKGFLKIHEMATKHLKNAFIKRQNDWLKMVNEKTGDSGKDFVALFLQPISLSNHVNLLAILNELNKRP